MADVTLKLDLPQLPNFLRIIGAEDDAIVDVAHVPEIELKALGEEWTAALIEHARERASEIRGKDD